MVSAMKIIVLFLFTAITSLTVIANENDVSISIGGGQVESEQVSSQALSYSQRLFSNQVLSLPLDIALGVRYTNIQSSKFYIFEDEEYLKPINLQALNLMIDTRVNFKSFLLGFNLDLLGYTKGSSAEINNSDDETDVVSSNFFFFTNDQGTLNSEFWIGKEVKNQLLRGGIAHIVIEYEGDNPGNEKRQRFFNNFFISLGYLF